MNEIENKIISVLDKFVAPMLATHGGGVTFISFNPNNGEVKVSLVGACNTCLFAQETMRMSVEAVLMQKICEVKLVTRVE
ncbi:MAG: NifU family protein [Synergistaceae bacterium]